MDQREELFKNGMLGGLAHHLGPSRSEDAAERQDNDAVNHFAAAMKLKMAASRAKGRSGWLQCPVDRLQAMLTEHLKKGDPIDIANFCMMLWSRGAPVSALREPTPTPIYQIENDEMASDWTDVCKERFDEHIATEWKQKRIVYASPPLAEQVPQEASVCEVIGGLSSSIKQLMKFYRVDRLDKLVEAQDLHIARLQARIPQTAQPTFPRVREG